MILKRKFMSSAKRLQRMIKVRPRSPVYEWCWNAKLTFSSLGSWERFPSNQDMWAKFTRDKRKITRRKLPSQRRVEAAANGEPRLRYLLRSRQFHVITARSMASETPRLVEEHNEWHPSPYDIAKPVKKPWKLSLSTEKIYFAANFLRHRTRPVMRWGNLSQFFGIKIPALRWVQLELFQNSPFVDVRGEKSPTLQFLFKILGKWAGHFEEWENSFLRYFAGFKTFKLV